MQFVWDSKKATANLARHRVDFRDAVKIFASDFSEEPDERFSYGEERWIAIGLADNQEIVVVYVEKEEGVKRIISARTATRVERERYWREQKKG